ncbi:hypothetical protein K474DRAFT_1679753 [Panus rudis PR-1116 ss-1]|nr:hypothetical protein K474DRAFT_1679753 [Panus rudis PR-1116 ss-1]
MLMCTWLLRPRGSPQELSLRGEWAEVGKGEARLPGTCLQSLGRNALERSECVLIDTACELGSLGWVAGQKDRVLECIGRSRLRLIGAATEADTARPVANDCSPAVWCSERPSTTGITAWDELFEKLKESDYSPSLVPCMAFFWFHLLHPTCPQFFARESGCLYSRCLFLHDKEACVAERKKVLHERRRVLRKPTMRELSLRWQGAQGAAFNKLHKETPNIAMICSNLACLKVQYKDPPAGYSNPDMRTECQRSDWKRHKTEACIPFEELMNNDDLWTTWGTRKRTGNIKIHMDEDS